MRDSTSTPKATSSEGQARPFEGENPGGLVSFPEKEGDARDERVSGSDDGGVVETLCVSLNLGIRWNQSLQNLRCFQPP